MNIQDPISDMIVRIKNNLLMKKKMVTIPHSRMKMHILNIMQEKGFICSHEKEVNEKKTNINIFLKYYKNKPVISKMKRVSKPSLRIYKKYNFIPKINGGYGVSILSTSMGIISDQEAKVNKVGGEIILYVF